MAAYDGSIRISTKLDTTDVKSELNAITKSLKGFAEVVVAAFSIHAIVEFGKACIDLASDLNEIQNVVDVTFGSSESKIEDFAKTATSQFGLSVLAAKQYTGTMGAMLKSMGFTTDAAADMSIEMASLAGDMASFYNLSTDEAFEKIRSGISGETEPLKELGVNLSEANLAAYALSHGMGTAYSKMSEQQKALVRYNYLLSVTSDAQGDFARTSNSWANQVRVLALQWDSFKATLGKAFISILTPVLQVINTLLASLNAAATVFANFVAAITGNSATATTAVAGISSAADDATSSVNNLSSATTASGSAAKAAAKGLASFDELNVLSDTSTDSGSSGGTSGTGTGVDTSTVQSDATSIADTLASAFDMSKYTIDLSKVKIEWETLKGTFSTIATALMSQFDNTDIKGAAFKVVLDWVYATLAQINLLAVAVGDLFIAFNVPATIESALDFLASLLSAIGDAVVAITPGVIAFVDIGLVPIAEWIGGKIRDGLSFFANQLSKVGDWFTAHTDQFTELGTTLGEIAAGLWSVIEPLADAAWDAAQGIIAAIVDVLLDIGEALFPLVEKAADLIGVFLGWANINGILDDLVAGIEVFKEVVIREIEVVGEVVEGIIEVLGGILDFLTGVFTGDWSKAWAGIQEIFSGVWKAIEAGASYSWDFIKAIWSVVAQWFYSVVVLPISGFFSSLWQAISAVAASAWTNIKAAWTTVSTWFNTNVVTPVVSFFSALWSGISLAASTVWTTVQGVWTAVATWFSTNVTTPVATFFSGLWSGIQTTWSNVASWFSSNVITPLSKAFSAFATGAAAIWDTLWSGVKKIINAIIGGVESFANAIISGINSLIRALNSLKINVPSWVTDMTGIKSFGFSIPTISNVSIPKLANGAVIPPNREFLAVLGDQKNGTNIETPLATMVDAFKAAINEMGGLGSGEVTVNVPVSLDGKTITSVVAKYLPQAQNRIGSTLVKVGS